MDKLFTRLFGAVALLGATLTLPTAAEAKTHHRHTTVGATHATSSRDAEGYFQWKVVGVRNMRIYQDGKYLRHNQILAMRIMGATEAEVNDVVQALLADAGEKGTMTKGMKFSRMSFSTPQGVKDVGKVIYMGDKPYAIRRIRTSSGRVFTIVEGPEGCDNVGMEEAPPPPPAPKAPPPPPPTPPEMTPPTPTPPALDVPPSPATKRYCNWRLNLVGGAELELADGFARSGYVAWGVYCMHTLKNGDQIGFGPAGQGAVYAGDPGDGHFGGHLLAAGVGMMYVDKDGQDLEVKAMLGDYLTTYNEGGYRQREHRPMFAISVAHNDYSRRLRGETSMPERQLFGMVGLPIGGGCEASWQGKELANCSNLSLYYNAGVRQWLTDTTYVQLGVLGEVRSGEDLFSCFARVGFANKKRTFGVHAGVNFCNGSVLPAIGAWYDLGTELRLKQAARRAAALSDDTGEGREATTTFRGRRLNATRE